MTYDESFHWGLVVVYGLWLAIGCYYERAQDFADSRQLPRDLPVLMQCLFIHSELRTARRSKLQSQSKLAQASRISPWSIGRLRYESAPK